MSIFYTDFFPKKRLYWMTGVEKIPILSQKSTGEYFVFIYIYIYYMNNLG